MFADSYYRGGSRALSNDVRDLRSMDFNDAISSLRIRSGSWQVCEDADFRGRCMTFDHDVDALDAQGFNDRISSVRRVR